MRLPDDSGALRLLQRIRDEAHRFANGYHSLLLSKRISESAIDDVDGVNESRKKALLAQFGSVDRLRKASVEAIAEVPGISERLATQIHSHLAKAPAKPRKKRRPAFPTAEPHDQSE